MIYMGAHTPQGLLIALSIGEENLRRIEADDPLMAQLSYVGYSRGVFFLYLTTEEVPIPPRMQLILNDLNKLPPGALKACVCGVDREFLASLRAGERYIEIEPGEHMPGVWKITLFYSADQKAMREALREGGLIGPETRVLIVPRSPSEN